MNKLVISMFVLVAVATIAAARHLEDAEERFNSEKSLYDDIVSFVEEQPERADRHARATCDLLSVSTPWGSLNHSACAAHCLALRRGFRGGRCMDGVCHCRK